jgi:FixJ family two-component response regulator
VGGAGPIISTHYFYSFFSAIPSSQRQQVNIGTCIALRLHARGAGLKATRKTFYPKATSKRLGGLLKMKSEIEPAVLLVDDDAQFIQSLSSRLAARSISVTTADNGQDALARLAQGGPSKTDVVILDVKMPGMDGLEVLTALKHSYPTVEVIMLAEPETVESAIEGMKNGASDLIIKPCDHETLLAKIAAAVQKKRDHEAKILEAQIQVYAQRRDQ